MPSSFDKPLAGSTSAPDDPPESLLAEIYNDLQTGICVFDKDERVVHWNAAFLTIFPEQSDIIRRGLPYEESLRRFFEINLSPEQLPFLDRHLAAGLARHRTQEDPFVYQRKDGRYVRCASRLSSSGHRVKFWSDVTAEHADHVRHSPVAAAVAAMNVGFALYDGEGRFVFGNKKLDELFPEIVHLRHRQSTYADHLTRCAEGSLAEAERPRLDGLIFRTNLSEAAVTEPMVFRRRDGGFVQLEERVTDDGGLVSVWIDVTERERAEAKLRESEEQFRAILESSPVGIVIGQRDGTRLFYNPRFAELHGLHLAKEGANIAIRSYVDPKRRDELLALVDRDGFFLDEEVELQRPDGQRWWALVSWKRITYEGKVAHLAWNYDITLRKEAERVLAREMSIAHEIQQSILPAKFPNDARIQVHATMQPAREIGGDFYDLFSAGKNKIGIVVADVSGKGVPAAFVMAMARTILKATGVTGLSPSACLTAANRLFMQEDTAGLFVTAFYGVLNVGTGSLAYASAGHNTPLLKTGASADFLPPVRGVPLGVADEWEYNEKTIQLGRGDCLLLYTDGVTEALNEAGSAFGEEALVKLFSETGAASAAETVRRVQDAVAAHSAAATQSDDITLMAVRYWPTDPA